MGALYLGLDVGTQGTKGLVLDAEAGRIVARAAKSYGLIGGLPPGAAEQHPQTWIDAVAAVAGELFATPGVEAAAVAGVAVSGQQHGLVVLDAQGEVIRPAKLWCDVSTADEAAELGLRLGRAVPTGFTASKIAWLARHEPEAWARTASVLLPHDYVNFRLTGETVAEAGDASGTGFFDVTEREWDRVAADVVDGELFGRLPPLVAAGEPAGTLSREGAELLGLPPGVLVASGGGDNMLSALGAGATTPGVVVVSLGTSGTAFSYSGRPVIDPEGLIAPFCDSTGGWLPLLCVMNMTGVTGEVAAAFGPGHDLEELTAAASCVPAGCDGLLWLPYLQGERVPDLPRATGTLLGMRPGCLRPEILFRAALEGTSLNLGWGLMRLSALGLPATEIRLVGGASANPLWRRILADVLGVTVVALAEPESAALGAALQALWTDRLRLGEALTAHEVAAPYVQPQGAPTEPGAEDVAVYAELGQRFRQAVARVYG